MHLFNFRLAAPDQRDAFGIIVSYAVKVKLFLGALGGELAAELPFVLMHPQVNFVILTRLLQINYVLTCFLFAAWNKGKNFTC